MKIVLTFTDADGMGIPEGASLVFDGVDKFEVSTPAEVEQIDCDVAGCAGCTAVHRRFTGTSHLELSASGSREGGPRWICADASGNRGVRYYAVIADELMGEDAPWASCGLTPIKRADEPAPSPGMHWVLFEDENAPPEFEGERVELTITRGRRNPTDLDESTWVSERRVTRL